MLRSPKDLRDFSGKSRAKVAADLGISERHLYRLEMGAVRLLRRHRLMFAAYYDVDPDEIGDPREIAA